MHLAFRCHAYQAVLLAAPIMIALPTSSQTQIRPPAHAATTLTTQSTGAQATSARSDHVRIEGAQAPSLSLHSVAHTFSVPALETINGNTAFPWQQTLPLARIAEGGAWTLYSRAANYLTCVARQEEITWLGTNLGVKCVDKKNRTVRHYTRLDGLPGDRVIAIALDDDAVWCAMALPSSGSSVSTTAVSLCRLDRKTHKTGRWETVHTVQRAVAAGGARTYADPQMENVLLAVTTDFLCVATSSLSNSAGTPLLQLYNKRLHTWQEIPCDLPLPAERTLSTIAFMAIHQDDLWLGTNVGLLRCHLTDRKWQRFLPNRSCYAGLRSGGDYWIVSCPADAKDPSRAPWALTRFALKTGNGKDYALAATPNAGGIIFGYQTWPTGISLLANEVWITAQSLYSSHGNFHCFDIKTEQWRTLQTNDARELVTVPEAALCQPPAPRSMMLAFLAPHRFPGWFCTEKLPDALSAPNYNQPVIEENVTWTLGDSALIRTEHKQGYAQQFPLTNFALPIQPPISAVALTGDLLLARTQDSLQEFDLQTGSWRRLKIPPDLSGYYPGTSRLIPHGDRIWLGTSNMVLDYDPKTERFLLSSTNQRYHRLLNVNAEGVWLLDISASTLMHATSSGEEPEPVKLPPTMGANPTVPVRPFTMLGDCVWCEVTTQGGTVVAGYDTKGRTWTSLRPVPGTLQQIVSFPTDNNGVYIATNANTDAIQRYDAATKQWSVIVPNAPAVQNVRAASYTLISVDEAHVWCRDQNQLALWDYDRKASRWTFHRAPDALSENRGVGWQQSSDNVVRRGDTLYLASAAGVMRFQIATRSWDCLPGIRSHAYSLQQIVGDAKAIWALGSSNQGNTPFVARFDKATQQWRYYAAEDGLPLQGYSQRLVADGESVWALTGGQAYHLDLRTDRWQDLSAVLVNDSNMRVSIQDIVPDGNSVWILTGGILRMPRAAPNVNPTSVCPLARYDITTGKFTLLLPEPGRTLTGHSLFVEKDALWLSTLEGMHRYDKAMQTWRKVEEPIGLPNLDALRPRRIVRAEGALWLVNESSAIRWTGP